MFNIQFSMKEHRYNMSVWAAQRMSLSPLIQETKNKIDVTGQTKREVKWKSKEYLITLQQFLR